MTTICAIWDEENRNLHYASDRKCSFESGFKFSSHFETLPKFANNKNLWIGASGIYHIGEYLFEQVRSNNVRSIEELREEVRINAMRIASYNKLDEVEEVSLLACDSTGLYVVNNQNADAYKVKEDHLGAIGSGAIAAQGSFWGLMFSETAASLGTDDIVTVCIQSAGMVDDYTSEDFDIGVFRPTKLRRR